MHHLAHRLLAMIGLAVGISVPIADTCFAQDTTPPELLDLSFEPLFVDATSGDQDDDMHLLPGSLGAGS